MNQITSTLVAAILGGFFSIVPATMYAPSAANDSGIVSENNFVATVQLDTSQVEAPAPFADDDYTCFRTTESPEWGCTPANTANPEIFTDPRVTDIEIVKEKDLN